MDRQDGTVRDDERQEWSVKGNKRGTTETGLHGVNICHVRENGVIDSTFLPEKEADVVASYDSAATLHLQQLLILFGFMSARVSLRTRIRTLVTNSKNGLHALRILW